MQTYPVDIDPEQLIRWLEAKHAASPSVFRITAVRATDERMVPPRGTHLDDLDREDLREIATIATLEIAPAHASEGWLLTVVVEDEVGPRLPDKGALIEDEQTIDLVTFDQEFIRTGRGNASVVAAVEGPEAEKRMARLLHSIEADRHNSGPAKSTD
ncbi:hypothetical protein [Mesorhizobium jarvisii]|uniref:hypothetical protein n=1 Tax=Mesorhizobium jarvisii TaxID=1777867 RepID=UPI001F0A4D36|nr:hypothetical protein [Mesorhizobium jarvisii]MCH4560735.1 hypothetical protein [Mesorhizobium jarvisii]